MTEDEKIQRYGLLVEKKYNNTLNDAEHAELQAFENRFKKAQRRSNLCCAWIVTAIIIAEWAALVGYCVLKGHVFIGNYIACDLLVVLCVIDVIFYWAIAHYIYENHELEFAILPIIIPILAGILLPVYIQARTVNAKRHKHAVIQRHSSAQETRPSDFFVTISSGRRGGGRLRG